MKVLSILYPNFIYFWGWIGESWVFKNVLIFAGYKVDDTSGELQLFNSKTATNIIVLWY